MSTGDKYIRVSEAARLLHVRPWTIRLWVQTGKVRGKPAKPGQRALVERASLKGAFKAKCILCGKIFKALHPRKAMYCCRYHADRYRYLKRIGRLPAGK